MEAPAESHSSGSSQVPSILRQRMLKRAATFTEGAQQTPPTLPRRRSSVLSNLSDAQHSFRSSTDSLLRPGSRNDMDKLTDSDGPTYWHSSPIVFAIVPAVAALTHQNGGAFATDILLILLACWFMSKCVVVPWEWYHNAQQRQYTEVETPEFDDTIPEEDDLSASESSERRDSAKPLPNEGKTRSTKFGHDPAEDARQALKREEMFAFVACFLGPLVGAYLLHTIRSQLTNATRDGIISDLNLTIFVLAAEMRPVSRLIEMKNEKTLHLQRIVQADPNSRLKISDAQELAQKIAELETRLDDPMHNSSVDAMKASADVRQSMQIQLDALNRAVRKYEKRHMAQSIQIEARFQEIDLQLKDTLSLAAAAARTGQRPGLLAMTISWIASVLNYYLQFIWDIFMYPWRLAASLIALVKSLFFRDKKQSRRSTRGQVNGHSSMATSRMQSKTAR